MIGYYVHHQGRGHLHRAIALAASHDEPVTGLSSLERPAGWQGEWLRLPRDDQHPHPDDVTAGGQLHWVPRHDRGLRARSALLSVWLERARPRLVVVDVSVEVALLVRLHGTPVVSVVLPGRRTDAAHLTGFRVSSELVAFGPPGTSALQPGLPLDVAERIRRVGAVSRLPVGAGAPRPPRTARHAVVLLGRGGDPTASLDAAVLEALAPAWRWTALGGEHGWVDDPTAVLHDADVVLTHAGESALADVAAVRRPAIVVPDDRPFDEQRTTAAVLAEGPWPALVAPRLPDTDLPGLLERAAALDGSAWGSWCDGLAARRFAEVVGEPAPVPDLLEVDVRAAG